MRKRYIWTILLAATAFLGWHFGSQAALKYFFNVSGTVTIPAELLAGRSWTNSMLFVVAKNEGGVPVAVRKIINPVFPAEFRLTASNLIMPDLLTGRVYLEAMLNTHGQLGVFKRGDLRGERQHRDYLISKGLEIKLDRQEK